MESKCRPLIHLMNGWATECVDASEFINVCFAGYLLLYKRVLDFKLSELAV